MQRDHGGGLDAARADYGGARADWLDLSTGINPLPYPVEITSPEAWTALPDRAAQEALTTAARVFWQVPDEAAVLAAPGASALIARLPGLRAPGSVHIPGPTYNEHAASFRAHGWQVIDTRNPDTPVDARVMVHPNNPTGQFYGAQDLDAPLTVIDESFCDVAPDRSLVRCATRPRVIVLKSFGKFWGLAGLRLGFAIGARDDLDRLAEMLGPWPVSGPALDIGTRALRDLDWARETRVRLNEEAAHLDALMWRAGAEAVGGCALFRLYRVNSAQAWHERLAKHRILIRVFPYAEDLIRLGLPGPDGWARLEAAL
ncbi:cobalamin biosynthetic protein CobC [Roseovarius sp. TM1035]|uniref:threonine-phosphate decarboxylase CobD n=1 Tax=Roseovarius sp. TM1035 TaxID=391613 RepID=UPI0001557316|nr:threonine-phosphate decarboxylase CobD [Roseovarius sp. TM1035]AWZ22427.1 L-threonine 3-O-phosphate decarboxylase [Roseovarius sp. AK1035]EDM32156.1 cobalamin biosynthetic protein CobC [Roseovarius sp. TM1035]